MDIIIVSAVYPPEPVISAQTSAQLAEWLAQQGHSITVITNFPNRPAGRIFSSYHRHLYQHELDDHGFEIIRCFSSLSPKSTLLSRLLENITFGITSSIALLLSKKSDVIYANTWPIFAQGLICLVARLRRVPIILSIQDIYPDSLSVQGRLSKSNIVFKMLHWMDRMNARMASALIVISERFARIYTHERGIEAKKVHLIPNWRDAEEIKLLKKNLTRKIHNITEDAFVLVYGGNIGAAAGVEALIQVMRALPDNSSVLLLIAGEGSHLNNCKDLARQLGIENIIFHSPWPSEETSSLLSSGDILVLTTKGDQSMVSVPSKLITYLFAGKPILALAKEDSEIADLMHQAGCGWVIEPDQVDLLVQAIENISKIPPNILEEMGLSSRKFALNRFNKDISLPKVVEIISDAVNRS